MPTPARTRAHAHTRRTTRRTTHARLSSPPVHTRAHGGAHARLRVDSIRHHALTRVRVPNAKNAKRPIASRPWCPKKPRFAAHSARGGSASSQRRSATSLLLLPRTTYTPPLLPVQSPAVQPACTALRGAVVASKLGSTALQKCDAGERGGCVCRRAPDLIRRAPCAPQSTRPRNQRGKGSPSAPMHA